MRRWFFVATGILLFTPACSRNQPPTAPVVEGPSTGSPGDTLVFTATSTDPDEDVVSYLFMWGDTSSVDWTPAYGSGVGVTRQHCYSEPGEYEVSVRARDEHDAESDWSASLTVAVGVTAPERPSTPEGPSRCEPDESCQFSSSARHPEGLPLMFQFDWGDTVGDWSGPVPSESPCVVSHAFDSVGSYSVRARARAVDGIVSEWSLALAVEVVQASPWSPRWFAIAGDNSGVVVQLSWYPPVAGSPDCYRAYFQPLDSTGFRVLAETQSRWIDHDPGGATGRYYVAAVVGGAEFPTIDTLTTVPVHTATTVVAELDAPGDAGFGWDRDDGTGDTYSMLEAGSADYVDFYITDFAVGSSRFPYTVASPNRGPGDEAGLVPDANWRVNGFTDPMPTGWHGDTLPAISPSRYFDYTPIDTTPIALGCYSVSDEHYGLIQVVSVDSAHAEVEVETWFQLVPRLRLVRH